MGTQRKQTQSYKLYKLFRRSRKGGVTLEQMAKATGLKPEYMGSYLTEMKRVYGAKITYHGDRQRYTLDNNITVPPQGMAGRRPAAAKVATTRTARARERRQTRKASTEARPAH